MIVFRLAAVAAGLSALFAAGLESGADPERPSPAARVVAALSARLHPEAPVAPVRRVALAAPVTAHALAAKPPRIDFAPVAAIKPTARFD